MLYLHIPKTAGTLFKNCEKLKFVMPFKTCQTHNITLHKHKGDVCFGIRNPWERFASGYWERVTNPQRAKLNSMPKHMLYRRGGYTDIMPLERTLFEQCATPNDVITGLRTGTVSKLYDELQETSKDFRFLTAPLHRWLGELEEYKQVEHQVKAVYDVNCFDKIFKQQYDIELPTDSFVRRTRDQFDMEQSYDISEENLIWFTQWRKQDYELIDYIVQQPYYITETV